MTSVFVDTSAWYAVMNQHDAHHQRAQHFLKTHTGTFLTTNYVITETANLILLRLGATLALKFLETIGQSQLVEVIYLSPEHHERTVALFAQWAEKGLSVTDCSSLLIMQEHQLTHAFCFDRDFIRAGLLCVP